MIAQARPAATVTVLRDGPSGLETLFLLRPVEAEFVPRAQVFPGGRIDADDAADAWDSCCDLDEAAAAALLGTREAAGASARAFLVGAVREVFEETGVLLGVDGDALPSPAWLSIARGQVHGSETTFAAVLAEAGLGLRLRDLVPFARWVTPEALPRRYDTFFLAAPMPTGQEAVPAPGEIASLEWVSPAAALARADSREAYTLPPTRAALTALEQFDTVATALTGLARGADLAPVLPRIVGGPGNAGQPGVRVLVPGDPGYNQEA
ncbi:MAG: NUDIX domain-containing protein [Candidatus Dormibacteria bacterium]